MVEESDQGWPCNPINTQVALTDKPRDRGLLRADENSGKNWKRDRLELGRWERRPGSAQRGLVCHELGMTCFDPAPQVRVKTRNSEGCGRDVQGDQKGKNWAPAKQA